jgi:enediyne biosynthesis protein E3
MSLPLGTLLKPVFPLSADSFPKMAAERFGAQEDMEKTWLTFEPVARTLVDSFYLTLDHPRHESLLPRLDATPPELRGIAYEGAGMGLMLLDSLFPYKKRLPAFIHGPGAPYRCLVYIGAGLVLPRVPLSPQRFLARQDPFPRWLVMDGYGFYKGFFSWRDIVERHRTPRLVRGYAARAFDHGAQPVVLHRRQCRADHRHHPRLSGRAAGRPVERHRPGLCLRRGSHGPGRHRHAPSGGRPAPRRPRHGHRGGIRLP